jgi:hypothetical protein
MEFLKSILETASELEQKRFYESIEAGILADFDRAMELTKTQNEQLDEEVAEDVVSTMGFDKLDEVERQDEQGINLNLGESLDEDFQSDVQLLQTVTEATVVGIYDIMTESFEQAVERIMKSDRKLRMTSKDGKTKYKTRRRAAEAAAAASMAAVFGKKGVSAKAKRGKKGG